MKEFILCAAIWYNDGLKHDGQPENITEYIVYNNYLSYNEISMVNNYLNNKYLIY